MSGRPRRPAVALAVVPCLVTCLVAGLVGSVLSGVVLPSAGGAASVWDPVAARLDQATTGCAELCGLELRVTTDGPPLYDRSHGDWERDRAALIASASKWISGATIMTAVDDGALALDDTVADFFPQYAGTEKGSITLAQLGSHTHGLAANPSCLGDRATTLRACAEQILATPSTFAPGTAFEYGSSGLQVAGAIVEIAEGESWEAVFRRNLADPLGFTSFLWALRPTDNPLLAGGAVTVASDYDRFLEMIQGHGTFRGTEVLSEAAFWQMETNRSKGLPIRFSPGAEAAGYGIGNWIELEHPDGTAAAVSSPGLFGTYPLVDLDRDARVLLMTFKAQFGSLSSREIMADLRPLLVAALAAPPGAPPAPIVYPGDGEVTVSWSPPADFGGAPVTGYTVTAAPGGATCTWVSGPRWCTIDGLTNGTPYTFTVRAESSIGVGSPPSPPSVAVVPGPAVDHHFHTVTPTRVLDSRSATAVGPYTTPWVSGTTRDVDVAGVGPVPAGADAVVLNVTTTGASAASFLKVWPAGSPRPAASAANWAAGQTVASALTVAVGAGGAVSVFNPTGAVDVVIDVLGWYDTDPGAGFTAIAPQRVVDSRKALGAPSAWAAGTTRTIDVGPAVPDAAVAVALNVTVAEGTAPSHLTLWPSGSDRPTASNLNWSAGQTVANATTVGLGPGGTIDVRNAAGDVEVIVDVVGWYGAGAGAPFHPLPPARVLDTRPPGVGAYTTPWGAGTIRPVTVAGAGGVPSDAAAVVGKVTVTGPTAASHLTSWPAGAPAPTASTLNWPAGATVSNALVSGLGAGGAVSIRNAAGTVDVVVDVAGWFG